MADEKEVTVKILTEVQDDDVKDLEDRLEELNDKEVEVDVTSDSSEVDNVESSVEDLETEIENVNNTPVAPPGDTSGVDEVSDSVSGLQDVITALGAGASLGGMEQMVATAGNIQDSWNRLGLTFGEVTGQMKTDISEAASETGRSGSLVRGYFNDMGIAGVTNTQLLQESFEALSGRAYQTGNSIESMEQKMKMMVMSGNAGARQLTQLGISTEALGRAMGVSADEASKMFKTLSQEERLRVLTKAMGDGKAANEQYKNSWQGLKEQVDKATGALMGAIGSAILPVLVPVMKAAADVVNFLADAFKKLPEPIRAVIGIVGALIMGFLAYQTVMSAMRALNIVSIFTDLIGALRGVTMAQLASNAAALANPYVLIAMAVIALIAALWYLYNTNESVKQAFDHVGEALKQVWDVLVTAFKPVIDAVIEAWNALMDSLGGSDNVMNGVIFGIVAFAEGLAAIIQDLIPYIKFLAETYADMAKTIIGVFKGTGEEGNTWLGNMLFILMGPIGWIILLCNKFEWLRDIVVDVLKFLIETFGEMFDTIKSVFEGTSNDGNTWLGNIMFILMGPIGWIILLINTFREIAPAVSDALSSMYQSAVNWFNQTGQRISNFISNAVNSLSSGAQQAVQSFADGLSGLVDAAWAEFNDVLNAIADFGRQAIQAAANIGNQIVQAIWQRHSPGIVAQATFAEMKDTKMFLEQGLSDMVEITSHGSDNIIDAYNPSLNTDIGNLGNDNGTGVVNNFTFNFMDFVEDKEKLKELIINTINNEIEWNNDTAGRTV